MATVCSTSSSLKILLRGGIEANYHLAFGFISKYGPWQAKSMLSVKRWGSRRNTAMGYHIYLGLVCFDTIFPDTLVENMHKSL
jgi:hypothetical protein